MLEILESKLFWLVSVFLAIYVYLKYNVYNYWKRHGIPHKTPLIPFGNINPTHFLGKISLGNLIKENYNKFKNYPFHGFYALYEPVLVINDPELIKTVLVKDFAHFPDRGWFMDDKIDPITAHLFLLPGEKWKRMRGKLSPIFTSGKLKQMYRLLEEISEEMIKVCNAELEKSDVLEIKDTLARYTTDIISSVVYGFNCDSLNNPKSEFRHYGMRTFEFGRLNLIIGAFIPEILKKMKLPFINTDVPAFFYNVLKNSIDQRREKKIVRKDLVNLLMQLMDHGELEEDEENMKVNKVPSKGNVDKITMFEAAAQTLVFFIAGYETASSTATYCLYELALNPEIQEELRKEVDAVAESSTGLNYDSITGMEYLDMVVTETLRMHPSVPFLNRICVEKFQIPNSNFVVPKGMRIMISTSGVHLNSEFYPNPHKFDPLRFSKENSETRSNYVNLSFGEGPRYCIGKRFGQLQTKLALFVMLRNYKFHICDKTQIPIQYATDSFVQNPGTGVYLRLEKRNLKV